jgi:hypothetical protein
MRALTDKAKVSAVMEALGKSTSGAGRIYFTGGVTAVWYGWRDATIDMDLKLDPEPSGIFEGIPAIKDRLSVNIELASPDQFIPELPGWRDRSTFIDRFGNIDFYHYDFYSQALAKLERAHDRDLADVEAMLREGLIEKPPLHEYFLAIEPSLIRFPSIDPTGFRNRVAAFAEENQ